MRTIRLLIATIAVVVAFAGVGAAAAGAQDYPLPEPPTGGVLPDSENTDTPEVAGDTVAPLAQQPAVRSGVAGLPVTGGDLLALTILGAGAVGVGLVLVRTRRTAS